MHYSESLSETKTCMRKHIKSATIL